MLDLFRRHRTFAALLAIIVLVELAHGIEIVTLLPLYLTRHWNEPESFVGLVASTYLLVDTLLTRTPAGWLADRLGRKPTLCLGLVLSLVPLPLMALASNPQLFVPLNVLNGIGAGMIWPSIYALVADLYGREARGTVLGLINMVMLGGLAAGGPITGSLLLAALGYPDPLSYARGFISCIALVLLALLILQFGVPGRTLVRARRAEQPDAPSTSEATSAAAGRLTFVLLLAIGFTITFALGLIVPVLTLFGTNVLKLSLQAFALVLLPPALTAALALIPAGRWADRRGRHAPMLLGLTLIAVPFWLAASSLQPLIVSAGAAIAALGYALLVPAWNALIMDWIPSERRGLYFGGVATVQGVGLAAGPVVGGTLFQIGAYLPFWSAGALLTMGASLALALVLSSRARASRVRAIDRLAVSGRLSSPRRERAEE